jgi:hypothetical protein
MRFGAPAASPFAIIKAMAAVVQTSPRIQCQHLFTLTSATRPTAFAGPRNLT